MLVTRINVVMLCYEFNRIWTYHSHNTTSYLLYTNTHTQTHTHTHTHTHSVGPLIHFFLNRSMSCYDYKEIINNCDLDMHVK